MGRAALALVLLVLATPVYAQKPVKMMSPDEALKHRGKWVKVCGIVRDAAPTEKGGKLYYVNAKGEAIWAAPILDLASRMSELPGAQVCTYGRTYWNLEGLGIDTERVEFMASRAQVAPPQTLTASSPKPASTPVVERPKKRVPWGAIVAAAVVGAAALTAAQGSGTTYYAPPDTTAPVPPTFASSSLWIDTVSSDGSVIVLSDGSVWSVEFLDQLRTSLWLPVQRVTIASGSRYGQFLLIRQGVRTETATVTRVR